MKTRESVSVSYKQCISTLESSPNVSSTELDLIHQKCNEAIARSRRIHSLIQSKYSEARVNNLKQSRNAAEVSSTAPSFNSTQMQNLSSQLPAQYVSAVKLVCLTY